jgi:hypothetical protein
MVSKELIRKQDWLFMAEDHFCNFNEGWLQFGGATLTAYHRNMTFLLHFVFRRSPCSRLGDTKAISSRWGGLLGSPFAFRNWLVGLSVDPGGRARYPLFVTVGSQHEKFRGQESTQRSYALA